MTTNRTRRTVRISIMSTFLALMAFAFLAFGSAGVAGAHTISHSASSAQTGSSSSTTVVNILSRNSISPNAITVKSRSHVQIVNKSPGSLLVFYNHGSIVLAPGAFLMLAPTHSQVVRICAGATLTITVG